MRRLLTTNKEKYIDNVSDEELAGILTGQCEFCENQNYLGDYGLGGEPLRQDCLSGIKKWLSQEAEEG